MTDRPILVTRVGEDRPLFDDHGRVASGADRAQQLAVTRVNRTTGGYGFAVCCSNASEGDALDDVACDLPGVADHTAGAFAGCCDRPESARFVAKRLGVAGW